MGKKRRKPVTQPTASAGAYFDSNRIGMRPEFRLWNPGVRSADSDNSFELVAQRGYSRDLYRTSPIAGSGVDQLVSYRVGTGLQCQPRILPEWLGLTSEQAEEWQEARSKQFQMWAADTRASVEGDLNFYELQKLIAYSHVLSGDVFVIIVEKERPGWPFKLALQVIEADRVCNENNGMNTNEVCEGVKRAADGEIVSIFVANHHPGGEIPGKAIHKWTEIPIRDQGGRRRVLSRKTMTRPGQTRGLPALSKIVGHVKQVSRYAEAEVGAAVLQSGMTVIASMDPDSFQQLFTDPADQSAYIKKGLESRGDFIEWHSNRLLNVLPGETITTPTPGRPNPNFDAFVQPFFTILGMGLNLPAEVMTGLYKSSYTAALAALQQLWQFIYGERASDVAHICQPLYEEWLTTGVVDGWVQAPGFLADAFIRYAWSRAEWTGSGPASLNPKQEAEAAALRARFLTSEETETNLYDGGDYASRHAQRAREAAARRRDGLPPLGGDAASPATPGAPAAPAEDDENDDDSPDLQPDQ